MRSVPSRQGGDVDHTNCGGIKGKSLQILRSGCRAAQVSSRSLVALVAGDIVADSEANHHRDEEAHVERHDSLRTSAAPLMMMLSALTHLLAAAKKDILNTNSAETQ